MTSPSYSHEDAWSALEGLIVDDQYGEMAVFVAMTKAALLERGVWASGQSAIRARQVAAAYGYRWDDRRKRFYRPWQWRILPGVVLLLGSWLMIAPWLFRSAGDSITQLVSATATALAALVALILAASQWRRPGPPNWYIDRVLSETEYAREIHRELEKTRRAESGRDSGAP